MDLNRESATTGKPPGSRLKIAIRGAVQGVGFRPFVYRLAAELGLKGWVNNSAEGVMVEVEGSQPKLQEFLVRLSAEAPPRSFIQSLEPSWLDPVGYSALEIRESASGGSKTALVLPDIATCPDCLREVFDPENRRFHYPFTNCTNCGPRFSIIEALPYDRANTSMKQFAMCDRCRAEYENPMDRRFHAQPNACADCGPHLQLWDREGKILASHRESLQAAADAIKQGRIVAVKGLGGFHLMVAAHDDQAIRRLRQLKHREEKPIAVMFPSLQTVKDICEVSPLEERLLRSPEAPIVLLRLFHASGGERFFSCSPAPSVAPGNPILGVLLPYTPLHHLLVSLVGFPVVATSGNLSDEPICTHELEALKRLGEIADLFLVHNRPIVRHVDDSIVRIMMGRELVLRRARGFAPLPIQLHTRKDSPNLGKADCILAVGAHLKNAVALSVGRQVFVSQHIGDLETEQAFEAFKRVIADFEQLYEAAPGIIVADAHPDYLSTQFARCLVEAVPPTDSPGGPAAGSPAVAAPTLLQVQHHVAHVLSCMAENELEPPVLGVSWDGTGYGLDGTIWGGDFFLVTEDKCERVAHLRQFRLPGGEQAIKEPRRTAVGLLFDLFGEAAFAKQDLAPVRAFAPAELGAIRKMLLNRINSPVTSSAGRLFDAVAALAGIRERVGFEGQAAMELEFAIERTETLDFYPVSLAQSSEPGQPNVCDWGALIQAVLADLAQKVPIGLVSARFHNGLAEIILAVAKQLRQQRVVLSGGCFQNRYLTERTVRRLAEEGFRPYWHQRIPPNDGGIALGQIVAARRGV